jgi:hypothetical protein
MRSQIINFKCLGAAEPCRLEAAVVSPPAPSLPQPAKAAAVRAANVANLKRIVSSLCENRDGIFELLRHDELPRTRAAFPLRRS